MGVGNENGFFFNHNWWEYNFEIEINEKIEGGERGEQTKIFAISKTIAHWLYTICTMGPMSLCSRIIIFMQFICKSLHTLEISCEISFFGESEQSICHCTLVKFVGCK